MQDTLRQNKFARLDTLTQLSDSLFHKKFVQTDSPQTVKAVFFQPVVKTEPADTTSLCRRNSIADVTFYDSANIVSLIDGRHIRDFPFVFTGINRKIHEETKAVLVKHLKSGDELPADLFHNDWVLPVILFSVFIYGAIKAGSGKFFRGILKFITFRGKIESGSLDIGSLFQWQSTLLNLATFINISMFAFLTALWYNVIPDEGSGFLYWLISFAVIISAITLRHFVCIISGNMSGETEVFREYLIGIYEAYRLAGLFLLTITILILYTAFIPVNILFYTGFSLVGLIYFIRVSRLFLIFINRHVSIFYLILYLCALEILPVAILVRYVTGLV